MVIWIIGLSASGKTTLGSAMYRLHKRRNPSTVFLDGDMVRAVTSNDLGHTVEGRRRNAERIRSLCLHLDRQGQDVICSILSIFPESSAWNRTHLSDYREIYMEASLETCRRRDAKGLYAGADAGDISNVVGVDIPFPIPESPDLIVNNERDDADAESLAREALVRLGLDPADYPYTGRSLLAAPERYEYALYQGAGFLKAYRCNRDAAVAALDRKIARIPLAAFRDAPPHPLVHVLDAPKRISAGIAVELDQLRPNNAREIVTADRLLRFLTASDSGTQRDVHTLLKRFEVSKKIRSSYGPDYTKPAASAGTADDALALYGLFGLVLATAARSTTAPVRLAYLNGLLKVCDILVAEEASLSTPLELYAARAAIRAEREALEPILAGGVQ